MKNENGNPKCLADAYAITVWLLELTSKYCRNYKFSLGDQIGREATDMVLDIQQASFGFDRIKSLERANRSIARLRVLLRLSLDLKQLTLKQLAFATGCLDEVGKQAGAWRKHSQNEETRKSV